MNRRQHFHIGFVFSFAGPSEKTQCGLLFRRVALRNRRFSQSRISDFEPTRHRHDDDVVVIKLKNDCSGKMLDVWNMAGDLYAPRVLLPIVSLPPRRHLIRDGLRTKSNVLTEAFFHIGSKLTSAEPKVPSVDTPLNLNARHRSQRSILQFNRIFSGAMGSRQATSPWAW